MTFEELVDQAIAMLERRSRVSYRAIKRQFQLDDDVLEDLTVEIIKAHRLAVDEDGEVLVWTGTVASAGSSPAPAQEPVRALYAYTPPHLAEKILTSKAALEGERKQVTVLFADLKGSMELLADRDPEEARQLLDPVLERMMAAVHRYEGTVNQVMGDGIMALFGAPIAHEDHAVRACYAALAMQEAIRRYSEEVRRAHGIEVQIRVGLNSGEVVVRAIGNDFHMDYSAIGQTTPLAARMEQLDSLPPASAEAMLQSLLGDDASLEPLKQRLIEQTQGNPFFLEESVRTLVETQVLVGDQGSYRLARVLPSIQVPATVQAVLAARIDRLPPEEKSLLQTAAVIGTEVPLALLQAIANAPEEGLHRGLGQLQAAKFLYETRLFPEHAYTFKHALTQQVAYETLLQERRRALHARIVEALEALAGDRLAEQVERLAHHALRGGIWDKALVYGRQAGEKAMARSAYREAVGYFEQALSVLPHLPEQRDTREQAIDLRLALRSALRPFGDFGRILAALREAESLAAALDDPRRLVQVSVSLSLHFYLMGAYAQAIATAQRALALVTASGEIVLHALANLRLGLAYQAQGDCHRAIDCYRQTVASLEGDMRYERFGLPLLISVNSRAHLAVCDAELGTFAEGRALGDEGLRIAEVVAHPGSLMYASCGIGLLALRQGDLPRALPQLERAVGICHDADLPAYFPWIAAALGAAYTLDGRLADAVPLLTPAMEQSTAMDAVFLQALCHLSLGEAQVLAGRLEDAHALAERALALAREHQERNNQAYTLRLLGEIAARREPPESDEAEAHYRQALALAQELGMRPLVAHCHLGLGKLYAKLGRRTEARTELSAAVELYRAMEMTFWLPQAEAALAEVEGL